MRRPRLADAADLFGFMGDKSAMRYTQVEATPKSCRRRLAAYDWRRRADGYGAWTIVTKAERRIIGWGGLYTDPFDPDWGPEIGYFFAPDCWGQGYASELAAACTALADGPLAIPVLSAFAHPDNVGSRRVLEKAGFAVARFVPEMNRFLYRRPRPPQSENPP